MFERPRSGERALLVHVRLDNGGFDDEGSELAELACSAGAEVVGIVTGRRRAPDPRSFVGSGKAEEIRDQAAALDADLVIFDHALSPAQERNLERLFQRRVLDRAGLILDIFALRARTHEGKLQVELAQLRHMSTRLVRGWTHLERQRGGIGLRGPGETQLESDRRLIADRIRMIEGRLEKVGRRREQGRAARRKAEIPTVSLVGYTNAGKSTLFNALTGADIYVADRLFATLDPTLRRVDLGGGQAMVLADTVGFVHDLPHELVAAFKSTLQETREAALLLHVIDAADEHRDERERDVEHVLEEIGAERVPRIFVYNKIDLSGQVPHVDPGGDGRPPRVWVSARTGAGIDALAGVISDRLGEDFVCGQVDLPPGEGRLRARLFALGAVLRETRQQDGRVCLEVCLPRRNAEILHREGLPWPQPVPYGFAPEAHPG